MPCLVAFRVVLCLLAGGVLGVLAPVAGALETKRFPTTETLDQIAISPGRLELEVVPGQRRVEQVIFINRLGRTVDMAIEVFDVSGENSQGGVLSIVAEAPFGANDWIKPEVDSVRMLHGDQVTVNVTVDPPLDLEPGSYYAAVRGTASPAVAENGGGAQTAVSPGIAMQFYFNVPGERKLTGKISEADSPWLFQRTRGRFVSGSVRYENTGNVTDVRGGSVTMKSWLGNGATKLPLTPTGVVLRGGSREFRYIWTDTPWIGRFTPKITVVSNEQGPQYTRTLDPIWIIPSWKYWLALILALALPIGLRIRSQRKWDQLAALLDDDEHDDYHDEFDDLHEHNDAYR